MPATTWKVIDEKNLIRQQTPFRAAGNSTRGAWSVTGKAYEDGLRAGVDVLAIDNGRLQLDVVPTRGMGIHRVGINGDQEVPTIGWKSPVHGPVHPWRVEEQDLPLRQVLRAEDARARRLWLVRDDGQVRPDEPVEQRGLARIRAPEERNET